jgi:hypothetical protein
VTPLSRAGGGGGGVFIHCSHQSAAEGDSWWGLGPLSLALGACDEQAASSQNDVLKRNFFIL